MRQSVPTPTLRWLALACTPGARTLEPPPTGWFQLLDLAERHRIGGLLWRRLAPQSASIPSSVAAGLKAQAQAITAANLRAALECQRVAAAFTDAGLPFLFLKGLALSWLAYGDSTVKMSRDIDLLVLPSAVAKAAECLGKLGYEPQVPGRVASVPDWHRRSKESVWVEAGGTIVELHSRLNDNPRLMAQVTAITSARLVEVAPGIRLPTLQPPELLAYLAVHGASSAWFRLKWLADFANLLRKQPAEFDQVYGSMLALGCDRAGGLALLLARRVFDVEVPPKLTAKLEADRAIGWLAGEATRQMAAAVEPTRRPLGTIGIHLSQLFIESGWACSIVAGQRLVMDVAARRLFRE